MKRIALTLISFAIGAAAIPAVAPAASYDVLVCHAATGNANHAFTAVNDNPSRLQVVDNCASGDEHYTGGLYAGDLPGLGFDTPEGQQVLWRMTAPAGLTITRWQSVPYVRNLTDPGWSTFFRTNDGTVLLSCKASGTNCLNGFDYDPPPGYTGLDWTVNATSIEFGSRCDVGATSCGNGASGLMYSLATLRSAKVTITDNGLPTVANVAGTLLAGGTLSGSKTVTLDASDASGISAVRLYIDGAQVQASSLTCDFTYAQPCSDVTGRSFTVDTTTLADGPHTVAVGALDAAGNLRQASTTSFTTNNTPVTPPPSGGGGGGGGGGGSSKPAQTPTTPTVPDLPPAPTVPVTPTVPQTPTVSPAPESVAAAAQLSRATWTRSGTLAVSGKLSRLATGSVQVTLSARVHGHTYTVKRSGRIRSGRWSANVRPTGQLAKAARLTLRVTYAGNSRVRKTSIRRTITRR
jgi:hypothetical protein